LAQGGGADFGANLRHGTRLRMDFHVEGSVRMKTASRFPGGEAGSLRSSRPSRKAKITDPVACSGMIAKCPGHKTRASYVAGCDIRLTPVVCA
jgi:hypothetical protein